jgi:hypothetical protein
MTLGACAAEETVSVYRARVAKQEIGLGRLDVVRTVQFARHVSGQRQNGRMIAVGFIKTGDQVSAAGTGSAGAYRQAAGNFCLAGGSQRRTFLMADADPFNVASTDRVGEWIQRVANETEDVFHPDLLEHSSQNIRDRSRHECLPFGSARDI